MSSPKARSCGIVCCLLIAVLSPQPSRSEDEPTPVLHEIEIGNRAPWFVVELTVGSQKLPFVIDTGASVTFYDDTLKMLLGEPIRTVTIEMSGQRETELFQSPQSLIGTFRVPADSTVVVSDLKPLSRATRCEIRGMVGMNHLKGQRWQFDADHQKLRVLASRPVGAKYEVPLTYSKSATPYVSCTIAKALRGSFLIDTGSSQSIIFEQRLFDSLVRSGHIRVVGRSAASDGNGRLWFPTVGRLRDFAVGELTLSDITVVRGGQNLIGMRFLSQFLTTLDFVNDKLYLNPGRRFNEPGATAIAGFSVFFGGDDLVVVVLEEGSPADKSGLRLNDVIEEIDNAKVMGKTLFEIHRLIEKPGQELKLRVRRAETTVEITIALPNV